MQKTIKELNVNENFKGNLLLKSCSLKKTSKGSYYLDVVLADASGQMPAKLWTVSDLMVSAPPTAGNVAYVEFSVEDYNGSPQARLSIINQIEDLSGVNLSELVPCAPADPETMYNFIVHTASALDQDYKNVILAAYERNKASILSLPAAKSVHHDFIGGLLYHTGKMLQTANMLCKIYPEINRDLLLAGVILHDIAKIKEFSTSKIGLVEDYSVEGNLLGHITMGVVYVSELCKEFNVPAEKSMLLQHMILAHHGEPEMGSPIVPKILEAKLLNLCDNIDAQVQIFTKATSDIDPGSFSERVFALGTSAYKPKL